MKENISNYRHTKSISLQHFSFIKSTLSDTHPSTTKILDVELKSKRKKHHQSIAFYLGKKKKQNINKYFFLLTVCQDNKLQIMKFYLIIITKKRTTEGNFLSILKLF